MLNISIVSLEYNFGGSRTLALQLHNYLMSETSIRSEIVVPSRSKRLPFIGIEKQLRMKDLANLASDVILVCHAGMLQDKKLFSIGVEPKYIRYFEQMSKPFILVLHDLNELKIYKYFERFASLKNCAGVMFVREQVRNEFSKLYPNIKTFLLKLLYQPQCTEKKYSIDVAYDYSIANTSRISANKRQNILLEIAACMPDTDFYIYSKFDGFYSYHFFNRQIPTNVKLQNGFSNISDVLQRHNFLIDLTKFNNTSNDGTQYTFLEAFDYNVVPIVSSVWRDADVNAIFIDEELIKQKKHAEIAQQIEIQMANSNLCDLLIKENKSLLNTKYNYDTVGNEYVKMFEDVLNEFKRL